MHVIVGSAGKFAIQSTVASTASDVQLAALFPPAQRPYILFLHAADSYRLGRQLTRYGHDPL